MFISIDKAGNGRYTFTVGDDPHDSSGAWLSSYADAAVLGETPTSFKSFGEAHASASRLVEERPSCVLAKKAAFYSSEGNAGNHREIAEGEVVAHYIEQVEIIGQRIAVLRDTDSKDFAVELEIVQKEVEGIKAEVEKLTPLADGKGQETFEAISERLDGFSQMIEQLGQSTKTASEETPRTHGIHKAAIRAFSEAAMLAVMPTHEDVFVRGASYFPNTGMYESVLATPKGDLVRLAFDKNLLLSGVIPCGQSLAECGGVSSGNFFLRYWEPIVNSVGHFHSKGHSLVAVAGMDVSRRETMMAFSMDDNSEAELSVRRPLVMGRRTWMLGKTAAKVTAPPNTSVSVGDEVECTAKRLPTYAGRTGFVSEVSAKPGRTLCRVDFRRGIGPVWLEATDVRKVSLGS